MTQHRKHEMETNGRPIQCNANLPSLLVNEVFNRLTLY